MNEFLKLAVYYADKMKWHLFLAGTYAAIILVDWKLLGGEAPDLPGVIALAVLFVFIGALVWQDASVNRISQEEYEIDLLEKWHGDKKDSKLGTYCGLL